MICLRNSYFAHNHENLRHYYHVYAAGAWITPVSEHLDALVAAGWSLPVYLGLVGDEYRCAEVIERFEAYFPTLIVAQAREGWEQLTLDAIRDHACANEGIVMYAHSKGAASVVAQQIPWRKYMTRALIGGWRKAYEALESGEYDAAGPHWISQELFPDRSVPKPCFAGNYWMATCAYLRTLPVCEMSSRYEAEVWIGKSSPRPLDLLPGWPPHVE